MNARITLFAVVVLATVALACILSRGAVIGPVNRRRVERFCRRQDLRLTTANGAAVLTYLAVTRRWRVLGLVITFVGYMVWELRRSALAVNVFGLLIGWFVGAVVAEWRINARITGERRSAVLIRRQPRAYINMTALTIMYLTVVAVLVGCLLVAYDGRHFHDATGAAPARRALIIAVTVLVGFVIVLRAQQRILTRPRLVGAADVVAADDAVRSRSLHVLTGAAIALAVYAAAFGWNCFAVVHSRTSADVDFLLTVVGPLVGARVATWPFHVAQPVTLPVPLPGDVAWTH